MTQDAHPMETTIFDIYDEPGGLIQSMGFVTIARDPRRERGWHGHFPLNAEGLASLTSGGTYLLHRGGNYIRVRLTFAADPGEPLTTVTFEGEECPAPEFASNLDRPPRFSPQAHGPGVWKL